MIIDVDKQELAWLIDGLMVLMHRMDEIPENDLSEMPQLQHLLERLIACNTFKFT